MRGFYIREQKHICGKSYSTAPYMEVDIFEVTPMEHKANRRQKRLKATSLAMQKYNDVKRGRYFIQLVATNVTAGWVHITLTYDNEHMPAVEDEAQVDRDRENYLRRVKRAAKKKYCSQLQYIGVTGYAMRTDDGKPGRHHIHILLAPCGLTREELEDLWGKGHTNTSRVKTDHNSAEPLARYLLHHKHKKRHWFQSRGLQMPIRPAPNDTRWSRKKQDEASTLYVDDREYWEKKYDGYTLNSCEVNITGSGSKHLIVKLRRKDWGKPSPEHRRGMKNQP